MVKRKDVMTNKVNGKFDSNWMGLYVIDKVYEGGAYTLLDYNGNLVFPPLNGKHLKCYYTHKHMFWQKMSKEANLKAVAT